MGAISIKLFLYITLSIFTADKIQHDKKPMVSPVVTLRTRNPFPVDFHIREW